tara:strand:- start:5037 stop:5714 length:678 start_codon:yes stop_codon:yes gene_type:complete
MADNLMEELLFPTPIWWTELDVDNDAIASFCYSVRDKGKGMSRSNVGGFQSPDFDGEDMLDSDHALGDLARRIKALGEDIHARFKPWGCNVRLANIWMNINNSNSGDYNVTHTHPGSVLSGVYYVKTPPDSGDLIFHRDHTSAFLFASAGVMQSSCEGGEDTPWCWSQMAYPPVAGRLMFFPAWLPHGVEAGHNVEDRISVSFNLTPQIENESAYFGEVAKHYGV